MATAICLCFLCVRWKGLWSRATVQTPRCHGQGHSASIKCLHRGELQTQKKDNQWACQYFLGAPFAGVPGGKATGNKAACFLEPVPIGAGKRFKWLVYSMICYKVTTKRKLGEHWRACCVLKLPGEIEQMHRLTTGREPKILLSLTRWNKSFIGVTYWYMREGYLLVYGGGLQEQNDSKTATSPRPTPAQVTTHKPGNHSAQLAGSSTGWGMSLSGALVV